MARTQDKRNDPFPQPTKNLEKPLQVKRENRNPTPLKVLKTREGNKLELEKKKEEKGVR